MSEQQQHQQPPYTNLLIQRGTFHMNMRCQNPETGEFEDSIEGLCEKFENTYAKIR